MKILSGKKKTTTIRQNVDLTETEDTAKICLTTNGNSRKKY